MGIAIHGYGYCNTIFNINLILILLYNNYWSNVTNNIFVDCYWEEK